ncbi:hypothetical protein [Photobacterium minamisatsumaniensis]|uniref:hypothetical protein n=1 Tax=Photobacterium minamisatsumaniensis TaxID=2910233 RepID=UPI003D0B1EF0
MRKIIFFLVVTIMAGCNSEGLFDISEPPPTEPPPTEPPPTVVPVLKVHFFDPSTKNFIANRGYRKLFATLTYSADDIETNIDVTSRVDFEVIGDEAIVIYDDYHRPFFRALEPGDVIVNATLSDIDKYKLEPFSVVINSDARGCSTDYIYVEEYDLSFSCPPDFFDPKVNHNVDEDYYFAWESSSIDHQEDDEMYMMTTWSDINEALVGMPFADQYVYCTNHGMRVPKLDELQILHDFGIDPLNYNIQYKLYDVYGWSYEPKWIFYENGNGGASIYDLYEGKLVDDIVVLRLSPICVQEGNKNGK